LATTHTRMGTKKIWNTDKMIETKNAIITSVRITSEDHGQLSAWIILDYGGSGQGFGGYPLYWPKDSTNHNLLSTAGHFISRVMEIAGVENWNNLPGKAIRVNGDCCTIKSIGHITKNDWFTPSEDFKNV